jgi:uncharacterized protein (TIGR02996 family)
MTSKELLAEISARPDDDQPRLAYADAVQTREPEYAEFIRLQVMRAQDERRTKARSATPASRELELLRKHGLQWAQYFEKYVRESPSDRNDLGWGFERGFLAFARMEPENFVALGDRLFLMAPIQHADLYGGDEPVRPLFAAPGLARLDSLSLRGAGLDDDDAIALAGTAALARATWLDLSGNKIGERGVLALAQSPHMKNKVEIILRGNPWDPADQPSMDWGGDGGVADVIPSTAGEMIEKKLGRKVPWFHTATARLPDRFHAKYAPRV